MWAPGGGSGPIDPKRLPEGYPYKEQSRTEYAVLGEVEFVDKGADGIQAQTMVSEAFVVGEKYAVVLDGKEYAVTAREVSQSGGGYVVTVQVIGNEPPSDGSFDENGPPFAFMTLAAGGQIMLIMSATEAGTHTVEIYKLSETIHPMAPEFLPALTSPNGTKYQLTVADDGTLSAVAVS